MSRQRYQIFFDVTGRRFFLVNLSLIISLAALSLLIAVFVMSSFTSPALPSVGLRLEHQYLPVKNGNPLWPTVDQPKVNLANARAGSDHKPSDTTRFGFFVNWDDNSFISLRNNARSLDILVPEWVHLTSEQGDIALDDERRQKDVSFWIAANQPRLRVMPLINNFDPQTGNWLGEAAGRLLRSPEARARFVQNLNAYLADGTYPGVVLDFKDVPEDSQPYLVDLIRELKAQTAGAKLKVLSVLPAYEDPANYLQLVDVVDQLILLAYDQNWSEESSGPLAGQGWFEELLDKRFESAAGEKLVVAIGSYAADRTRSGLGKTISVRAAWDILGDSGIALKFDKNALNPYFSYRDGAGGERHEVWMLDGVTVFNQIAAALSLNPGGIALWRLGTEDPTAWHSFAKGRGPNREALDRMRQLDPGDAVSYKGEGEVLKFTDKASEGRREITHLPKYNLIVDESVPLVPHTMTISRWGLNRGKIIALTFDDGPSREFTPAILDILKQKNVKGSFFVIGAAAVLEPRILERMYKEGHDIGNHTFTHPNLSRSPNVRLELELNATQRVLESKLGIRSVLFRPPFAKDMEPETRGQARTLLESAALGYIAIGQKIDPLDWGLPGAEKIVQKTVEYARSRRGNVVLLHDGGGDRSQTIEALPKIIDQLRAEGFEFVSLHELLGLQRGDLMPQLHKPNDYVPYVNELGFSLANSLTYSLNVLFIIGITLGVARLLAVTLAACWQARLRKPHAPENRPLPEFAVIVPAYNEERVIAECVHSILKSNLRNFEVVVVDDGSTDATVAIVREEFANEPRVRLFTKRNGGKASALNHAIRLTSAEVVVCIDADTRMAPDALEKLLGHFHDPQIGAVAGVAIVGNKTNLLSRFQALEYLTSQNLDRRAFELFNGISVVPGAIGAWRRRAITEVGLYDTNTFAEDADLTLKVERANWRVINESDAFAVTEAPDTLREFSKQRFRWMFGTLQVAFKHSGVYFQKGAWGLKLFTMPNIVIFQYLFTLISPVMDILLIAALGADAWSHVHHDTVGLSDNTIEILMYWLGFQTIELVSAGLALALHGDRRAWRLLPLIILQRFCYRQLIYWIAIQTFFAALSGSLQKWGKPKRLGLSDIQATIAQATPILTSAAKGNPIWRRQPLGS